MPKASKKNAKPSTDDAILYTLSGDLLSQSKDEQTISKEEAIELLKKKIQQLSH